MNEHAVSKTQPSPDFMAEVLAYIAAHLFEPMTVGELAYVAGYSPYHFSRLFTARFGVSVMGYVRDCRLQDAALKLTSATPPSLIDLSLDCGFESQEAFTRAFRRLFGVPPGQFKRSQKTLNTIASAYDPAGQGPSSERPSTSIKDKSMSVTVELLSDLVKRGPITVAGVGALFTAENKHGIPALWPRLIRALPLTGQVDGRTYGVCKMEDQSQGCLRYIAGVEVAGAGPFPDGFETITLQPHTYAVFRLMLDGSPLHPQMQVAMPQIWGKLLPQAGLKTVPSPDFELYPADFEPMRKGAYLDYCVAVEA